MYIYIYVPQHWLKNTGPTRPLKQNSSDPPSKLRTEAICNHDADPDGKRTNDNKRDALDIQNPKEGKRPNETIEEKERKRGHI